MGIAMAALAEIGQRLAAGDSIDCIVDVLARHGTKVPSCHGVAASHSALRR